MRRAVGDVVTAKIGEGLDTGERRIALEVEEIAHGRQSAEPAHATELIVVVSTIMSDALVPTVRPETTTTSAEVRNSAFASDPTAAAAIESGVPDNVSTDPDTVPAVAGRTSVASTPVAPDNAEVPRTSFAPEPRAVTTAFIRVVLSAAE